MLAIVEGTARRVRLQEGQLRLRVEAKPAALSAASAQAASSCGKSPVCSGGGLLHREFRDSGRIAVHSEKCNRISAGVIDGDRVALLFCGGVSDTAVDHASRRLRIDR